MIDPFMTRRLLELGQEVNRKAMFIALSVLV
jgi:hypothetical protein